MFNCVNITTSTTKTEQDNMKLTFKPQSAESRMSGSNCTHKDWNIIANGKVVGVITSTIRDLNGSYTNPSYGVTINAELFGTDHQFHKSNNGWVTSIANARYTRSGYVNQAKAWAVKAST